MAPSDSDRPAELQELMRTLRPRIIEVLTTYQVPEDRAAEILHETFIALAVRWNRVGNRTAWIVGTVEARCRAWAKEEAAEDAEDARRRPGRPDGAPPGRGS